MSCQTLRYIHTELLQKRNRLWKGSSIFCLMFTQSDLQCHLCTVTKWVCYPLSCDKNGISFAFVFAIARCKLFLRYVYIKRKYLWLLSHLRVFTSYNPDIHANSCTYSITGWHNWSWLVRKDKRCLLGVKAPLGSCSFFFFFFFFDTPLSLFNFTQFFWRKDVQCVKIAHHANIHANIRSTNTLWQCKGSDVRIRFVRFRCVWTALW